MRVGADFNDFDPSIAVALAAAVPSALAAQQLLRHTAEPQALAPAIRLTIAAALLHGLLLAGTLLSGVSEKGGGS